MESESIYMGMSGKRLNHLSQKQRARATCAHRKPEERLKSTFKDVTWQGLIYTSQEMTERRNQKIRVCELQTSANNDLACNETRSVCISEEFHVLLAIKAACKVALKVN